MPRPPPHKSRRAVFPHRALQDDSRPPSTLRHAHSQPRRRTPDEGRALPPGSRAAGPETRSTSTPPLTAAMKPGAPEPHRPGEELRHTGRVPVDAIVAGGPAPCGVQLPAPVRPPGSTPLLAPRGHPLERVAPRLARRPALAVGLTSPGSPRRKLTTRTVAAGVAGRLLPGERDDPRLARGPLQPDRAKPLAQFPGRTAPRRPCCSHAHTTSKVREWFSDVRQRLSVAAGFPLQCLSEPCHDQFTMPFPSHRTFGFPNTAVRQSSP